MVRVPPETSQDSPDNSQGRSSVHPESHVSPGPSSPGSLSSLRTPPTRPRSPAPVRCQSPTQGLAYPSLSSKETPPQLSHVDTPVTFGRPLSTSVLCPQSNTLLTQGGHVGTVTYSPPTGPKRGGGSEQPTETRPMTWTDTEPKEEILHQL